jgi:hypothetical protein
MLRRSTLAGSEPVHGLFVHAVAEGEDVRRLRAPRTLRAVVRHEPRKQGVRFFPAALPAHKVTMKHLLHDALILAWFLWWQRERAVKR